MTFRCSNSVSNHKSCGFEFLMMFYCFQSLYDVMDLMEDSVKSLLRVMHEKCDLEQNHFFQNLSSVHKNVVKNAAVKEYLR